jgi:hypothetical protein
MRGRALGVGKTALLRQFTEQQFSSTDARLTIGVEFGQKALTVDNKDIVLEIWDTVSTMIQIAGLKLENHTHDQREPCGAWGDRP